MFYFKKSMRNEQRQLNRKKIQEREEYHQQERKEEYIKLQIES